MRRRTRELMELFPGARLDITPVTAEQSQTAFGRHKPLDIYQKIELHYGDARKKCIATANCYGRCMRDQIRWIYDRNHLRKLTHENGRASLAMAVRRLTRHWPTKYG